MLEIWDFSLPFGCTYIQHFIENHVFVMYDVQPKKVGQCLEEIIFK